MTGADNAPMAKHKLTYQLVERAVELKRKGLNDCDIAAAIGVCKQTFSKWINHPATKVQRELAEQLKKAESDYKAALLDTIKEAALAKNSFWTAAAWLLERKYPDEYSQNRRAEDTHPPAPTIVLGVPVAAAGREPASGARGAQASGGWAQNDSGGRGTEPRNELPEARTFCGEAGGALQVEPFPIEYSGADGAGC